jgi:hypothetical protein
MNLIQLQRAGTQASSFRRVLSNQLGSSRSEIKGSVGEVISQVREIGATGRLSLVVEDRMWFVFFTCGRVYFAQAEGEDELSARLVADGVITSAHIDNALRLFGNSHYLGLVGDWDAEIDQFDVMACVDRYTLECLASIRQCETESHLFEEDIHHASGIVRWDTQLLATAV